MKVIKLGKNGQVSIPKAILKRLGLNGETMLLVETTADGGILLPPAGVYPNRDVHLGSEIALCHRHIA